jgi:hypothetical protein
MQLQALRHGVSLDFWKLICFTQVAGYWLLLNDLGHDRPTIYPSQSLYLPEFTSSIAYNPTNNIFANSSLFTLYNIFLADTLLPLLGLTSVGTAKFAPLDQQDRFHGSETIIQRSYNCIQRKGKEPISAMVAVAAASYVLIHGMYSFTLLFAGMYQKWNDKQGIFSLIDD